MTDTNVIKLAQPGTFTDSLTEILRNGARALLTQAVEMEVADFLGRYSDLKTEASRASARARDHDRHRPGGGAPADDNAVWTGFRSYGRKLVTA